MNTKPLYVIGARKDVDMIISLSMILEKIKLTELNSETILVGIDGGGAAGKSTIAGKLNELDDAINVIHMDDFFKPVIERNHSNSGEIGALWNWRRVIAQVLEPLKNNKEAKYQIYDWDNDVLTEWVTVPPGYIVIVEGCYSLRKEMSSFYDYKIWVDSPRDFRLHRGVSRDGEQFRSHWEEIWLPEEDKYFDIENPKGIADFIIDGTGEKAELRKFEVFATRVPSSLESRIEEGLNYI